jgi:hypothetical protein
MARVLFKNQRKIKCCALNHAAHSIMLRSITLRTRSCCARKRRCVGQCRYRRGDPTGSMDRPAPLAPQ